MPPAPGLVIETWAVTPSRRSCSVSRNPVFIASAITNVATPAATPITENAVTRRSTAGRYGDRKYRLATNHSNFMLNSSGLRPLLRIRWRLRPQLREQNDVTDGGRVRKEHRQAVDADAFARRRRHAMAQRANIIPIHLLRHFVSALCHLRLKAPLLFHWIVQLRKTIRDLHPCDVNLETLGHARIIRLLLRQGRNVRRKFIQNSRLHQLIFGHGLKQHTGPFAVSERTLGGRIGSPRALGPRVVPLRDSARPSRRTQFRESRSFARGSWPILHNRLPHRKPLEFPKVQLRVPVTHYRRTSDLLRQLRGGLFVHVHQIALVAVRLI